MSKIITNKNINVVHPHNTILSSDKTQLKENIEPPMTKNHGLSCNVDRKYLFYFNSITLQQ